MKNLCVFFIVTCFLDSSYQTSVKSVPDDYYIAAVVETEAGTSAAVWETYVAFIEEAATLGVDIIVFPENDSPIMELMVVPFNGILKTKPVPASNPNDYDPNLVRMSEAAKNNAMYVIVNIHELVDCTDTEDDTEEYCPEEKEYIFNTNLVFDRNGAVIYRYRKNYLYLEPKLTPSLEPGIGFFTTDFGVTFGILICFDLINPVPLQAAERNISNIVANSNWIAGIPFTTAIQSHEAIAYYLNVNLLMSGANDVTEGASGSGIYSGKNGALISFMTGLPSSRLLVAKVPKIPGNAPKNPGPIREDLANLEGLTVKVDQSLPWHKTKPIVPGYQEFTIVSNDLTCKFRISMREKNGEKKYKYRVGALSGLRSLGGKGMHGVRDCSIFACTEDSMDTCGLRFGPHVEDATAIFDELSIEGSIFSPDLALNTQNTTFYPNTLDVYLLPLESKDFDYSVEKYGDVTFYHLSLNNPEVQLYSFSLWGRQFDWDYLD